MQTNIANSLKFLHPPAGKAVLFAPSTKFPIPQRKFTNFTLGFLSSGNRIIKTPEIGLKNYRRNNFIFPKIFKSILIQKINLPLDGGR